MTRLSVDHPTDVGEQHRKKPDDKGHAVAPGLKDQPKSDSAEAGRYPAYQRHQRASCEKD